MLQLAFSKVMVNNLDNKSVLYSANLWSRYNGLGAQKLSQKFARHSTQKVRFYYSTDKIISFVLSLFRVVYLRRLVLNQVWYPKEKDRFY